MLISRSSLNLKLQRSLNYWLWLLDSLPRCSVDQMNRAFSLLALCGDHFTRRTSPIHKSTSQASSPEFLFLLRLFIPPPPSSLLIYNTYYFTYRLWTSSLVNQSLLAWFKQGARVPRLIRSLVHANGPASGCLLYYSLYSNNQFLLNAFLLVRS